jgi:5-formyltetrahydrofolate cyclo-ligase
MSKQQRRKEMKARLSLIDVAEHKTKSRMVSQNLLNLLGKLNIIQENILIGAFAPFDCEPDWHASFTESFDKLTAFPSFDKESNKMKFRKAAMKELILKKDFGSAIPGPDDNAEEIIPGVILVPGLVFNHKGERLGRGKGFYDRYLENYRGITIGVCYEVQLDDSLSMITEEHDIILNFIVTEENIITVRKNV